LEGGENMKKYLNKAVIWEAVQEMARVAFFGAVSALISFGLQQLGVKNQQEPVIMIGTLLLKGLDKYIHDNPKIDSTGLTDTKMIGIN
jgi:hypothetical protein